MDIQIYIIIIITTVEGEQGLLLPMEEHLVTLQVAIIVDQVEAFITRRSALI